MLRLSGAASGEPRRGLLFTAGVHGREWIGPMSALYAVTAIMRAYGEPGEASAGRARGVLRVGAGLSPAPASPAPDAPELLGSRATTTPYVTNLSSARRLPHRAPDAPQDSG